MRQMHWADGKLFIDYAAPTIGLTGGSRAHIFVAALGASSYTFACATPSETMKDWLEPTARALAFIGGVPQLTVPDFVPRNKIDDDAGRAALEGGEGAFVAGQEMLHGLRDRKFQIHAAAVAQHHDEEAQLAARLANLNRAVHAPVHLRRLG